jgi:hypothetical protein
MSVKNQFRLVVSVELLQRSVAVELDARDVEAMHANPDRSSDIYMDRVQRPA